MSDVNNTRGVQSIQMKYVKDAQFVRSPNDAFISYRMVTESDGMGFTVCKTVIPKGGPWRWHYKNHVEACYCVSGHGIIKELNKNGLNNTYHVVPDSLYALPNHENHTFEAFTDVVLISVFNPPLRGGECHDRSGNYS